MRALPDFPFYVLTYKFFISFTELYGFMWCLIAILQVYYIGLILSISLILVDRLSN